jgi:hypothetical protein
VLVRVERQELAAVAYATEMLLKTYAKPTGRVKLPCWPEIAN